MLWLLFIFRFLEKNELRKKMKKKEKKREEGAIGSKVIVVIWLDETDHYHESHTIAQIYKYAIESQFS